MTITVLLADDQELVRTGFQLILESFAPEVTTVGVASDGQEAVEMAQALRPDVCLLDIRMPKLDGIEATRILAGPGVADPLAVVIVTTFGLDDYVFRSLKAGARGFLLKDIEPQLLLQAIRSAVNGDALVSPQITARLLNEFANTTTTSQSTEARSALEAAQTHEPHEPLSRREEEVLLLVAQGRTNNEIVESLHLSLSTIKSYISSIMRKIGSRNRVELAIWAHQTGRVRVGDITEHQAPGGKR